MPSLLVRSGLVAAAAAMALGIAPSALAQGGGRLPPPPSHVETEDEQPAGPVRADGIQDFVAAYKRAGKPKFLIRTVFQTPQGTTLELPVSSADRGVVQQLTARIRSLFNVREIAMVNETFLTKGDGGKKLFEGMQGADLNQQALLLGKAYNAGLVLLIQMLDQGASRTDGVRFIGSYSLVDMRSGLEMATTSWTMKPDQGRDFSQKLMNDYAAQLSAAVIREFVSQFPAGSEAGGGKTAYRPMRLLLLGDYGDDEVIAFRDAVQSSRGVEEESVQAVELGGSAGRKGAEFELSFAGDRLTFGKAIRDAVRRDLKMEPSVVRQADSDVILKLRPRRASELERLLGGGGETDENRAARERLLKAYQHQAAEPTIAVIIAYEVEPSKAEPPPASPPPKDDGAAKPDSGAGQGGQGAGTSGSSGVTVVVPTNIHIGDSTTGAGGSGGKSIWDLASEAMKAAAEEERRDTEYMRKLDARSTEDRVYGRLIDLRLKAIDQETVNQALAKDQEFAQKVRRDDELARQMGAQVKADIIVRGIGRRVPGGVRYSFRMIQVRDGRVLAAAAVERFWNEQSEEEGKGVAAAFNSQQFLDLIAEEATGKMMAQYLASVEPPQTLEVVVSNCATDRQLDEIMSVIKQRFARDSDGDQLVLGTTFLERIAGSSGGLGRFRISYKSDFDRLRKEILGASDALPFDFDESGSNRNQLALRIKAK